MLVGTGAFAADTVKMSVRHMCCGGCKSSAAAPIKALPWVADVAIAETTITVTAKEGMKPELVSLMQAGLKGGFPAREINTGGAVTLTMAHLCCPSCVNDMKAKIAEIRSMVLDKDSVTIDAEAKTVTLKPQAGKVLNVAALLRQVENVTGFSASKCILAEGSSAALTSAKRAAK